VTVQRIFFGAVPERHGRFRDLGTLELANTIGLLSLILVLGLLPAVLMDSINFSVITLLSRGGG
jgi:NADH:ubiquinone oxidoreductase subunit 4 (subunit M)